MLIIAAAAASLLLAIVAVTTSSSATTIATISAIATVVSIVVSSSRVSVGTIGVLNIIALLAFESHGSLNLFNDILNCLADFSPLASIAGVLFALQDTLVLGQLRFALDHLEVTLDFKCVTKLHQALVDFFELCDFSWRRDLELTELLHVGVVKIETVLLIVERIWTSAVALLLALGLLESVHLIALGAFCLRLGHLDFASFDSVCNALLTSCSCLFSGVSLGFLGACIFTFRLLHVLSAEVDEFLTKVDVGLVWVFVEFLKLFLFPLFSFFFLFFAALLLSSLVLVILLLTLFCHLSAGLVALFTLLIVLGLAVSLLSDHLLGLSDPLDIFDESLLDLIITHASVEGLLAFSLLVLQFSLLLHNLVNLYANIGQVILLKLLVLVKLGV